jgi:hypothetical protein
LVEFNLGDEVVEGGDRRFLDQDQLVVIASLVQVHLGEWEITHGASKMHDCWLFYSICTVCCNKAHKGIVKFFALFYLYL